MSIIKKIIVCIKNIGAGGGVKYIAAILCLKRKWAIFENSIWRFYIKKYEFYINIRPYSADIYLIRALVLGANLDGRGEYDFLLKAGNEKFPKYIIDCGANIGFFSLIAASKYKNATIIAIEPEKSNFELLKRNIDGYHNIICMNEGVWNRDTYLELLNASRGSQGYIFGESESETEYHALGINSIMNIYHIEGVDILKMDIEGSEFYVFDKNLEWLCTNKCLIIETHDKFIKGISKKVSDTMEEHGFLHNKAGENEIYYQNGIELELE